MDLKKKEGRLPHATEQLKSRRGQAGVSHEAGPTPSEQLMGLHQGGGLGDCRADQRVGEGRQKYILIPKSVVLNPGAHVKIIWGAFKTPHVQAIPQTY